MVTKQPRLNQLTERHANIRSALRQVLRAGPFATRDLSARGGISEKEVAGHLEHLARSLRQSDERLRVEPAKCLACGFVFKERTRLTKPSRCPKCKGQCLHRASSSCQSWEHPMTVAKAIGSKRAVSQHPSR